MVRGHPRRSSPLSAVATRGVTTNATGLTLKAYLALRLSRKRPEAGKFQRAAGDVTADFN
jgi:hypothetical protein